MANRQRDRGKERFWQRHVAGWRRSGLSVRDYCRTECLAEPSFYAWRRVLAERARHAASDSGKHSASAMAALPAFVPVRLIEETSAAAVLEVVLRGGRVVRVPAGFAAAALREVVAVLEGLPC
jgi:transposase